MSQALEGRASAPAPEVGDLPPTPSRLSEHVTHVGLIVVKNALERGITFVAVLVVLRALTPIDAGGFALMLKISSLAAVFVTLGLQGGAVRLISDALSVNNERRAELLLRTFLNLRLLFAVLVGVGGWFASPMIATHLLQQPHATVYVRLACVGAATNGMLLFTLHHLQARRQFFRYAILDTCTTLAKAVAVIALILAGVATGARASAAWVLIPLLGTLVGLHLAPTKFLRTRPVEHERGIRWELVAFGRWLTLAALANLVFFNLDSILLARYRGLAAVATYSAAFNLALVVYLFSNAVQTVLLPTVSRLRDPRAIRAYFRSSLIWSALAAAALAPLALMGGWLIRLLYGASYINATNTFELLYLAALVALIYNTAGLIFFALDAPRYVTGQTVAQLITSVPAYLIFIPRYGIIGGAIGTLSGQLATLAFTVVTGARLANGRRDE